MTQDIRQIKAAHKAARPEQSKNPAFFYSHRDLGFVLELNDKLIYALEGVISLSDRDHELYDVAKYTLKKAKGQSCK